MRRRLYGFIAAGILLASLAVGAMVYSWEVGASNYTVTLNPSQTAVDVKTTTALYSIVIFLCGAFFSAGLAMLLNLIELEKR
jgi:ABC-type sugar transport system permease subunit